MAKQNSVTFQNLEAAFAGESMAHIKYRYFAKLAREAGAEDVAKIFEETAEQEVMHAFGHLDLLYPKAQLTPAKALEIAIEGETYEYTEMYPKFRHLAVQMVAQLGASILTKTHVRNIDTRSKSIITNAGNFDYDRLVLAVGAQPIRLALDGDAAEEVISVNHVSDYALFRQYIAALKTARIAILGAWLIGCEFPDDSQAAAGM